MNADDFYYQRLSCVQLRLNARSRVERVIFYLQSGVEDLVPIQQCVYKLQICWFWVKGRDVTIWAVARRSIHSSFNICHNCISNLKSGGASIVRNILNSTVGCRIMAGGEHRQAITRVGQSRSTMFTNNRSSFGFSWDVGVKCIIGN